VAKFCNYTGTNPLGSGLFGGELTRHIRKIMRECGYTWGTECTAIGNHPAWMPFYSKGLHSFIFPATRLSELEDPYREIRRAVDAIEYLQTKESEDD